MRRQKKKKKADQVAQQRNGKQYRNINNYKRKSEGDANENLNTVTEIIIIIVT